jgi:hypothetical protein
VSVGICVGDGGCASWGGVQVEFANCEVNLGWCVFKLGCEGRAEKKWAFIRFGVAGKCQQLNSTSVSNSASNLLLPRMYLTRITRDFWTTSLQVHTTLDWYFEAIEQGLSESTTATTRSIPYVWSEILLVDH